MTTFEDLCDVPYWPMEVAPARISMGFPAYWLRPPSIHGGESFAHVKSPSSESSLLYNGKAAVARPLGIVAAWSNDIESGI